MTAPHPSAAPMRCLFTVCFAALFAVRAAHAQPAAPARTDAPSVEWSAPEDGGTPRDPTRIERAGPAEFRIRAAFEEGGPSALRHAVSRVDLVCRNPGARPVAVTLHLDLSGDGKRTDYDTKPESGMRLRDF